MRKALYATLLILAALLAASCRRTSAPPAATGQVPVPASPTATASALPDASPSVASRQITLARETPSKAAPPAKSAPLTPAGLMALGRGSRILPEDFTIGPLGDPATGSADERAAMSTAQVFLSRLTAGSVDASLLTPDSRDAVVDSLHEGMARGYLPRSARLGVPTRRDTGEVTATVRLFGTPGTSEGVIYLARSGSEWLVADLQLSLAQIGVAHERPQEKFFPSAYRWLLED